jgi:ribosomal protein S18 acetylase RimI-like enzyme
MYMYLCLIDIRYFRNTLLFFIISVPKYDTEIIAMTLPISLRRANPSDAEQLVQLGRSVNLSTFGKFVKDEEGFRRHLETTYTVERVLKDIENPEKDFIVAVVGGEGIVADEGAKIGNGEVGGDEKGRDAVESKQEKIIGFATLVRSNTYPCLEHLESIIELGRIYIYPEYHGRGVGKALMGRVEEIARGEGRKNMWLGCYEDNEVARKVYEKAGFVTVGERFNKIGEDSYRDLVMVKRL